MERPFGALLCIHVASVRPDRFALLSDDGTLTVMVEIGYCMQDSSESETVLLTVDIAAPTLEEWRTLRDE